MWNIKKINEQTKLKHIDRYREQISGYQRGRGCGQGKMDKGSQQYADGWKLNFWWSVA